jgi:hypothetical protein
MTIDPLDFLDMPSETTDSDVLSFLDQPKKSKIRKPLRIAAQYGIGNIERLAAPYEIAVSPLASKKAQVGEYRKNLFDDIERLQEQKQTGVWDKQDEELLQNLVMQAKDTKKSEPFVKTADIGTASLIEKGAKPFGINLEPEGGEELASRVAGGLITPKSIVKGAQKAGQLFTKTGRQELSLAKQEKNWQKLTRSVGKDVHKQQLVDFARSKNLTPEEATLLIQSDGKVAFMEKIGRKSKKFKETVSSLKSKLGDSYDELKASGKEKGVLGPEIRSSMQGDFQKILNEIEESYVIGPDTKAAKNVLEETQQLLGSREGTIKDLINSRQEIRQGINWRNVDRGDHLRDEAVKAITRGIEAKDPEIAKRLLETDKAWSRYSKYADMLDKKQAFITIKGVPVPNFMGDIAFGGLAYSLGGPKALITKFAIKELATKMVMDPKYQAIHKNLIHALQTGSTKKQAEIFVTLKRMIKKDDSDLYKQLEEIEISD